MALVVVKGKQKARPRRKLETNSLSTLDMVSLQHWRYKRDNDQEVVVEITKLWYFALTQNSSLDTRRNNRVMACSSLLRLAALFPVKW